MNLRPIRAWQVLAALLAGSAALAPATVARAGANDAPAATGAGTGADGRADSRAAAAKAAAALHEAREGAQSRHLQVLNACAAAPNPAACRRDETANYQHIRRALAADEQRLATPPPPAAQDAQRIEGQRLIRELERATPMPRPPPPGSIPNRPGMGRPFGR